jgi:hypothetical protein
MFEAAHRPEPSRLRVLEKKTLTVRLMCQDAREATDFFGAPSNLQVTAKGARCVRERRQAGVGGSPAWLLRDPLRLMVVRDDEGHGAALMAVHASCRPPQSLKRKIDSKGRIAFTPSQPSARRVSSPPRFPERRKNLVRRIRALRRNGANLPLAAPALGAEAPVVAVLAAAGPTADHSPASRQFFWVAARDAPTCPPGKRALSTARALAAGPARERSHQR